MQPGSQPGGSRPATIREQSESSLRSPFLLLTQFSEWPRHSYFDGHRFTTAQATASSKMNWELMIERTLKTAQERSESLAASILHLIMCTS